MSDIYGNISIASEKKKTTTPAQEPLPAAPPPQKPQRPPHSQRLFRKRYILVPLVGFLFLFAIYSLSSIFVPIIIEKKAPGFLQDKTGLIVDIGQASFNPLTCMVGLEAVSIKAAEKDGSLSDILALEELFIDLDFISLLRNGIVTEKLDIRGMTLSIRRNLDNSYNLSPFFTGAKSGASDILDFSELPFLYSLNNISISEGTILFKDLVTEKEHRIENLRVNVPTFSNFSFQVNDYIQPRFSAIINGSPIELVGEPSPHDTQATSDLPTTLSCSLKAINIPLYAHYLPLPLPVQFIEGTADGKILISFVSNGEKGRHLVLNYQLNLKDIAIASHDEAITLSTPILSMEGNLTPLTGHIHLENVLIRDPTLTVKKSFSSATVDSLFLAGYGAKRSSEPPLQLPALDITLLIADNGTIIIEGEKENKKIESTQLSIRDFANGTALRRSNLPSGDSGTFRLTGAFNGDFSTFSWQGAFAGTVPGGSLEMNNVFLADLIALALPQSDLTAEGSVNVRGELSLNRSRDNTSPVSLTFSEGTLRASAVSLMEKSATWFKGPSLLMQPVSFAEGKASLGNIIGENIVLQLRPDDLPTLVGAFAKGGEHKVNGIDLKGEMVLEHHTKRDPKTSPPWKLADVHLQILDKADDKGNNFAFSGRSLPEGKVQARGKISADGKGALELAFSDLPGNSLSPWLPTIALTADTDIGISGSGTIQIPEKIFKGSLDIKNGHFSIPSEKSTYGFVRGLFETITIDAELKDITASKIILDTFRLSGDDLNIEAENIIAASLVRQKDTFSVDELSLIGSEITIPPRFGELLHPFDKDAGRILQLNKVNIAGRLNLLDKEKGKVPFLEDYQLTIDNLGSKESKNDNITLHSRMEAGATILINGAVAVHPLRTRLALQFSDVDGDRLHRLITPDGRAMFAAKINGTLTHNYPEDISTGSVTLTDGSFAIEKGAEPLIWEKATLTNYTYTGTPSHLRIPKLELEKPNIALALRTSDILERIDTAAVTLFTGKKTTADATPPLQMEITTAIISNGSVDYHDERVSPPLQIPLTVHGEMENIQLSGAERKFGFNLHGNADGSPYTVAGTARFADTAATDYQMQISDAPLSMFEGQLDNILDFDTFGAIFDFNAYRNSTDTDFDSSARITFKNLRARQDADQTARMLALLTDANGSFTREIILKVGTPLFTQAVVDLQRLLVKSNFSPFLLLPPAYSDLEEKREIVFAPGEVGLNGEEMEILSLYGELLLQRPALKLILETVVDSDFDRPALLKKLEEKEEERVRDENEILLQQWQQRKITEPPPSPPGETIIIRDIPTEELEAFTPLSSLPVQVDRTMLLELGRQRVDRVVAFLQSRHTIEADRLSVAVPVLSGTNGAENGSALRLSLGHLQ